MDNYSEWKGYQENNLQGYRITQILEFHYECRGVCIV